jgi:hypothetical protein
MRFRRITLLVAIYLALDFANPMMPGAFQLVHGSVETVAGCQARSGEAPVLAVTTAPWALSLEVPQLQPSVRASQWVISFSPPVPVLFRTPFEPRSTFASSPDDD